MSNPALFFTVVLDRPYKLRYSGAAKQRMADLRERGYTLRDIASDNSDIVQAALFAWAWACISEDNPHRSPADFREVAERCKPELIDALFTTTVDCIKAGLPSGDPEKNGSPASAPSPTSNSA